MAGNKEPLLCSLAGFQASLMLKSIQVRSNQLALVSVMNPWGRVFGSPLLVQRCFIRGFPLSDTYACFPTNARQPLEVSASART